MAIFVDTQEKEHPQLTFRQVCGITRKSAEQIWQEIKPLRENGHTNEEIAAILASKGIRGPKGGTITQGEVSRIALRFGGESVRRKKFSKRKRSRSKATKLAQAASSVARATKVTDANADQLITTIANVATSNIAQETKISLVKQLAGLL